MRVSVLMRVTVLALALGSATLVASAAADWDLDWKKIEPYTGRTAAVTKSVTATTPVDGRAKTWYESLAGALDTFGLGLLMLFR